MANPSFQGVAGKLRLPVRTGLAPLRLLNLNVGQHRKNELELQSWRNQGD